MPSTRTESSLNRHQRRLPPDHVYTHIDVTSETNKDKTKTYVARFGGIPLRRNKNAVLTDIVLPRYIELRSDLLDRKRAKICEMCEATGTKIEVHHIHALKDLNVNGQRMKKPWEVKMSAMSRKTLMVCRPCHLDITYGRF